MSGAAFVVELTVGDEAALLKADPGVLESPLHTPLHPRQTAQCQGVGVDPRVDHGFRFSPRGHFLVV